MTARTSAAEQHLEAGRHERPARQDRPMRGEQRAGRPGDRATGGQRRDRADRGPGRRRGPTGRRGSRRRRSRRRSRRRARRGSRSPRKMPPRMATQTGIIAMSSAVMPDGTSARRRRPAPSRRRAAAPRRSRCRATRAGSARRTIGRSRAIDQVSRIRPASRNRVAAMRNGGIESTAMAIAEVGRAPDEVEDEHPEPDRRAPLAARAVGSTLA